MKTRLAKKIAIPEKVTIATKDGIMTFTGPKGEVNRKIPDGFELETSDGQVGLIVTKDVPNSQALFGLTKALVANAIKGVSEGFEKVLEIEGVGYRAEKKGETLVLSLGFSHQVEMKPMPGLTLAVEQKQIKIFGADNEVVGEMAAKIRALRPPEPYKGKGIHYLGEYIRRKAGKAGKVGG